MQKGIFIVIEGTDGSGKATQARLLATHLRKAGHKIAEFDFPQYFKSSSDFVKAYLQGRFGSIKEVSPRKASLLYAFDRFEASADIKKALSEGKVVLANRYVGSNMGHQGAKISDTEERLKYFIWDMELEYNILEIPRPDINIILRVPAKIAQKLVDEKLGKERFYTNGKKRDLHEASLSHLKKAETTYTEIARYFPKQFTLIDCAPEGRLLPVEDIAGKILKIVKKKMK